MLAAMTRMADSTNWSTSSCFQPFMGLTSCCHTMQRPSSLGMTLTVAISHGGCLCLADGSVERGIIEPGTVPDAAGLARDAPDLGTSGEVQEPLFEA